MKKQLQFLGHRDDDLLRGKRHFLTYVLSHDYFLTAHFAENAFRQRTESEEQEEEVVLLKKTRCARFSRQ